VDVDPVDSSDTDQITQPIKGGTNKGRTAESIIDELSLGRHKCAVVLSALIERSNLALDCVRGCLLSPETRA
jgi:hypothetical protein